MKNRKLTTKNKTREKDDSPEVTKFNLTFWGEIQAGKDPHRVKPRFAKLFDINDPMRLEHFFSGDTIILRRNLDRKVAGEYFSKLNKLGVVAKLVKVESDTTVEFAPTATPSDSLPTNTPPLAAKVNKDEKKNSAQQKKQKQATKKAADAEKQRKSQQLEQQHRKLEADRLDASRESREEQAIVRVAAALTKEQALKPAKRSVRSRLELPTRNSTKKKSKAPSQAGAPNFYQLHPFRNTGAIKERAALAKQRRHKSFNIAVVAVALLMIFGGVYLSLPAGTSGTGAVAGAVSDNSQLLLITTHHIIRHDRSGLGKDAIAFETLGVSELSPPLLLAPQGELIVAGRLLAATDQSSKSNTQLLRCDLDAKSCSIFSSTLKDQHVTAIALHSLTGELFALTRNSSQLLKLDSKGQLLKQKELKLPENPALHLDSGLLLISSPNGPAISIYRYEDKAFAQQLDEILLLPPPAVAQGQTQVWDFARSADTWWVVLQNPETKSAGLYRFDSQWNYLNQVTLQSHHGPQQVLPWGEKLLIIDPKNTAITRFNRAGKAEVPLSSNLLDQLSKRQQIRQHWQRLGWMSGLVLGVGAMLFGLGSSYLNQLRTLVYRRQNERGAEPIDDSITEVKWIDSAPGKANQQKLSIVACILIGLSTVMISVGLGASTLQLTAVLIAVAGPLSGLIILTRCNSDHVGVLGEQLMLVSHSHMYHVAGGSRLHYRGPFLLIDDVVVFTGSALLPVLNRAQLQRHLGTAVRAAVKVDYKTVVVKLLQSHHPLAQGAKVAATCTAIALAIFALGTA